MGELTRMIVVLVGAIAILPLVPNFTVHGERGDVCSEFGESLVPVYILGGGHNGISYYELYVHRGDKFYLFEKIASAAGIVYTDVKTVQGLEAHPAFYGCLNIVNGTLYYYSFAERTLIPKQKIPPKTLSQLVEAVNR